MNDVMEKKDMKKYTKYKILDFIRTKLMCINFIKHTNTSFI